jgi:hypothetical protein
MKKAFNTFSDKFWDWIMGVKIVEENILKVIEETKKRTKRVKEEACDVVKAVKEVGKQLKDIPEAVKGSARKGRKSKKRK